MANPKLRFSFPPIKVTREYEDTGIIECVFEDRNRFDMFDDFQVMAEVDPVLVAGTPQTFTFPHITNIRAIWWEFSNQEESTTNLVTMTLVDGTGPMEIRSLKKYFFCFCNEFQSVTLEAQVGDNVKLNMIILGE